jgi:hypothetical protein
MSKKFPILSSKIRDLVGLDALAALHDVLMEVPESHYDQREVYAMGTRDNLQEVLFGETDDCRTIGCAWGYAKAIWGSDKTAPELFCITANQSDYLFGSYGDGIARHTQRQYACARIRRILRAHGRPAPEPEPEPT